MKYKLLVFSCWSLANSQYKLQKLKTKERKTKSYTVFVFAKDQRPTPKDLYS